MHQPPPFVWRHVSQPIRSRAQKVVTNGIGVVGWPLPPRSHNFMQMTPVIWLSKKHIINWHIFTRTCSCFVQINQKLSDCWQKVQNRERDVPPFMSKLAACPFVVTSFGGWFLVTMPSLDWREFLVLLPVRQSSSSLASRRYHVTRQQFGLEVVERKSCIASAVHRRTQSNSY